MWPTPSALPLLASTSVPSTTATAFKRWATVFGAFQVMAACKKVSAWKVSPDEVVKKGVGTKMLTRSSPHHLSAAISLAGHLKLDNLVLIYDDNSVTVDGNIDLTFTDDTCAKMRAQGWEVIDVQEGGTDDAEMLADIFEQARNSSTGKPVFIRVKTVIGFGSKNAGLCPTHGAALGIEDVRTVKMAHGQNPDVHFQISSAVYDVFAQHRQKLEGEYAQWTAGLARYARTYPQLFAEYQQRFNAAGDLEERVASVLPPKSELPTGPIPTRQASGIAVHALAPHLPQLMAGSADLMDSTFVSWPGHVEFQSPHSSAAAQALASGHDAGWHGRQVRYGIREHAMAAIANGLSAYSSSSSALVPVISTFFMFFLYAAPAIRMAALQRLRLIGVATHDSIGIGEDGPTHQPVELASLFRAMPNLNFVRPADAEEVMGAWKLAMSNDLARVPSIFSLSRQGVPLLERTDRTKMLKGAYTVYETGASPAALVLVASGSEVSRAIEVAQHLQSFCGVRVVSMPSQRLFDKQTIAYRTATLPMASVPVVAIEAYASYGWPRYAHASVSMHSFGLSGPQEGLYEHFGFGPHNIAHKVKLWAREYIHTGMTPVQGHFRELLLGTVEEHGHYF